MQRPVGLEKQIHSSWDIRPFKNMKCRIRVKIGVKRQSAVRERPLFTLSLGPLREAAVCSLTPAVPFRVTGGCAHVGFLSFLGQAVEKRWTFR